MPESEYEVELFRKQGFTRQTCSKCHTPFWSLGIHDTCGEAPCQEYDFIGASPFKKKLTYRAMREDFLSFLEQNGHTRVKRYPIVARWRDDVFFVQASVYPFQPWVISGEASPPANPLAISQPCVRFLDIDNVGKTGQHFTMFEMMAHHAFNFPKKFIYFKDRTVEICHLFLTDRLGVDPTLVRYKESWWEGGGNSGPCFEVVFGGAEPATLVFMMNREINGHRVPMDTQVVDTGYGLERLTWLSQATTSAYEAVFGEALAYLKRATGAKRVDDRVLREYSKVAGMLKVETLADIRVIRQRTAERVGISIDELVAQVSPLESLYTVCDHSRALIFLLGDGVVPSNSRGGYFKTLLELYDSQGLNPDVVQESTDMPIEIPDDFYRRVAARHERPVAEPEKRFTIQKELPPTKLRVYEDRRRRSFRAKVVAVEGEAVVLHYTLFYPGGGGPENHHRTVDGRRVVEDRRARQRPGLGLATSARQGLGPRSRGAEVRVSALPGRIGARRRVARCRDSEVGRGGVWRDARRPDERRRAHQDPAFHPNPGRRRPPRIHRGEGGVRGRPETVRGSEADGRGLRRPAGPTRSDRRTNRLGVEGAAEAFAACDGRTGRGEGPGSGPDDECGMAARKTRGGRRRRFHDVHVEGDRFRDEGDRHPVGQSADGCPLGRISRPGRPGGCRRDPPIRRAGVPRQRRRKTRFRSGELPEPRSSAGGRGTTRTDHPRETWDPERMTWISGPGVAEFGSTTKSRTSARSSAGTS